MTTIDPQDTLPADSPALHALARGRDLRKRVPRRAHARSGDPATIAGYLGRGAAFDDAMAEFGARYADQTERDHAAFVQPIRAGRIPAVTGI